GEEHEEQGGGLGDADLVLAAADGIEVAGRRGEDDGRIGGGEAGVIGVGGGHDGAADRLLHLPERVGPEIGGGVGERAAIHGFPDGDLEAGGQVVVAVGGGAIG